MGNEKSHTVNPNAPSSQQQHQGQTNQDQMMHQMIREAFRNCSQNGVLTKDGFNQALSILEAFEFKRLRDTPLAERLFYTFDKNNSGTILEAEFIKGIGEVINDRETAINYTFKAYDRDRNNCISRKEFMQFIEESWRAAFRLLAEGVDHSSGGVTIQDIENWSASKISALNEQSSQIFSSISRGSDKIDYIAFKNYIQRGDPSEISVKLDDRQVSVPLNLMQLH